MRPLLLTLLLLLPACVVPAKPPPQESELLYRVFAVQVLAHDTLLETAKRARSAPPGELLGALLVVAGALEGAETALQADYPASLHDYAALARTQQDSLATISRKWIGNKQLTAAQATEQLRKLDTLATFRQYGDWLVTHGYSPEEVQAMDARLRQEFAQAFAP